MEQTNITNDTNKLVETPPINSIPLKPNNIYKYLFFVTLIILFGSIIYFYTNLNNKNPQTLNNNVKNVVETIPTEIVEDENKEEVVHKEDALIPYKAVFILDDAKQVTKLVLIDRNFNETVIDESKYWQVTENILKKPNYRDFVFSSKYNFLYYVKDGMQTGATPVLFDLKNNKPLQLIKDKDFFPNDKGFISDSKYFYACSAYSLMENGVIIKNLNSMENIFTSLEADYKCIYDKELGELLVSEVNKKQETLSQYKFSERTGVLTKIK